MALAGTWRAKQSGPVPYVGALKQGTGVNAVHGIRGGAGRDTAPDGTVIGVPDQFLTEFDETNGYTTEDECSTLWGYGIETGTASRPSLDMSDAGFRAASTKNFPWWGRRRTNEGRLTGIPGGTVIRSEDNGAELSYTTKLDPKRSAAAGKKNKDSYPTPEDSQISDESQYIVQTSMVQRDKTRTGSQMPEGRANTFDAPIKSRIPGPRSPAISGGYRHVEMEPKSQDAIIRPFWNRTAGTGPSRWMQPNAAYESVPLTRVPPDDPYSGREINGTPGGYLPDDYIHGYTDEDVVY